MKRVTDFNRVLDYIRSVSKDGEAFVTQAELAAAIGGTPTNMWYALRAIRKSGKADVRPVRGTFVTLKDGKRRKRAA